MVHRVMVIAGEVSGDMHGASVIHELKKLQPNIEVFGVGGDAMKREGMEIVYHVRELNFMGFVEVLKHLPFIQIMTRTLEQLVKIKKPDVLLLIDYPGFNLRFVKIAKRYGVHTVYYISPQVWAWHRSRIYTIKKYVDRMLVIFPFEEEMYRSIGASVEFVGHPLLDVVHSSVSREKLARILDFDEKKPILALLPGSRIQEIEKIFPSMLSAARQIKEKIDCEIIIAVAPTLEQKYFRTLYDVQGMHLVQNMTYDVVAHARCALVTSGTATLETAILGTPMVVVYRTSWITYFIARALVRIRNIGLVNIVAGSTIVPECIQHKANPRELVRYALEFMTNDEKYNSTRQQLAEVRARLGTNGAARRVAERILHLVP
ncbi:MAG: lipid-A-disaccharide synthase [Bacteroidetes bacterium]|nr:lipid-A-disaccharide synthase [Bacteroidota bacterium]